MNVCMECLKYEGLLERARAEGDAQLVRVVELDYLLHQADHALTEREASGSEAGEDRDE